METRKCSFCFVNNIRSFIPLCCYNWIIFISCVCLQQNQSIHQSVNQLINLSVSPSVHLSFSQTGRSSHNERSSWRSTAERNDPSAASVAWLTASWPGNYSNAQWWCRRTGHAVTSLFRTATSFRNVMSFWNGCFGILTSRRHSGARRRWSRTVVVSAQSVTRSSADDNCAVQAHCHELRRLNHCLPITACGRHICALV